MTHHLSNAGVMGVPLHTHSELSGTPRGILALEESGQASSIHSAGEWLPSAEQASPRASLDGPSHILPVIKAACLVSGGALSATVWAVGFSLLAAVVLCNTLLPPNTSFVRTLYFDYTQPAAYARTSLLLPDIQPTVPDGSKVKVSGKRVIPSGQRLDVFLELDMPDNLDVDMVQIRAQLMAEDGRVAASISRPFLPPVFSPVIRNLRALAMAPLVMAGLREERRMLRVPLFVNYRERSDSPFTVFQTTLQAISQGATVPKLYSARMHVALRINPVTRLLAKARPGRLGSAALACMAVWAMGCGACGVAAMLALWLLTARPAPPLPGARRAPASDVVSSEEDASEASSGSPVCESDSGSEISRAEALHPEDWKPTARPGGPPPRGRRYVPGCDHPPSSAWEGDVSSQRSEGTRDSGEVDPLLAQPPSLWRRPPRRAS